MATESNLQQSSSGVRTYRGRTLEEILPQIRAELGAEAIILREREGLVGGVGGFFAQRFIEVDARRGEGQSIDIYDDAPEHDMRARMLSAAAEPTVADAKAILPPEPTDIGLSRPEPPTEPTERPALKRFVPPTVDVDRGAPETPQTGRRFETGLFMERLREASAEIPDDTASSAAPGPGPQPDDKPKPTRKPRASQPRPARPPRPAPRTAPSPAAPRTAVRKPPSGAAKPPSRRPTRAADLSPKADLTPPTAASTPIPPVQGVPANPKDLVRQRPQSLRDRPTAERPTDAPTDASGTNRASRASGSFPPAVVPKPGSPARIRRDGGLRGTLARLLGGGRRSSIARPAPAKPLDVVAAREVAQQLSTRGASQAWTAQLITAAGAHGSPLARSLREAAEAEVARRIMPAPALPAGGAAIAFIGAGGSGKTRCTAALASAYRRSSTLSVSVIALDNPEGARELRRLLADDDVPVMSLSGYTAKRAVDVGRQGGLVIVDTSAATPTDRSAVEALGLTLEVLDLDATYVTLPATLGPQAARRALASFGALKPAAVAITHADETDQLAVVIEIAVEHRIPLAYFHSGTDHRSALSAVDPPALAHQLLPS